MGYRRIDAASAWRGESYGLNQFRAAFEIDCKGDIDTFRAVYGWTMESIKTAMARVELGDHTESSNVA